MKEKIAKIIQDGVCSGNSSWDEITIEILKAMREPTDKMLVAGRNNYQHGSRLLYKAMIDSIVENK